MLQNHLRQPGMLQNPSGDRQSRTRPLRRRCAQRQAHPRSRRGRFGGGARQGQEKKAAVRDQVPLETVSGLDLMTTTRMRRRLSSMARIGERCAAVDMPARKRLGSRVGSLRGAASASHVLTCNSPLLCWARAPSRASYPSADQYAAIIRSEAARRGVYITQFFPHKVPYLFNC